MNREMAVHSLLAIARDTSPFTETNSYRINKTDDGLVMDALASFLKRKPYRVDYSLPYSEVRKDFISFCISRSQALDPSRPLDIICRPWAPPNPKSGMTRAKLKIGAGN
jgi:hypothetical protein